MQILHEITHKKLIIQDLINKSFLQSCRNPIAVDRGQLELQQWSKKEKKNEHHEV